MVLCFPTLGFAQVKKADSTYYMEVNFRLDSSVLSAKQKAKIDSVLEEVPVDILKDVQIYGYTDSLASDAYNLVLSKRRVQSVLKYLVYKGLDPIRVKADYYGEQNPKYDNGPSERYKNRRVALYFTLDFSMIPPPDKKLTDLEFKKGDKIRIPNLNFVGNQPIPVPESFDVLSQLLEVMHKYPDLKIELQGHVCCSDDQELSEDRARMVYDFLVGNGIEASRMTYKGFSNKRPLFKERTEKDRALNRRVEVLVISNSDKVVKTTPAKTKIDLRAPVLGVTFIPNKSRLYPAGDFMLTLIAESIRNHTNINYEFVIFDNINNTRLTQQRAAIIERTLISKKVNREVFNVITSPKTQNMTSSQNNNLMMVKISQK